MRKAVDVQMYSENISSHFTYVILMEYIKRWGRERKINKEQNKQIIHKLQIQKAAKRLYFLVQLKRARVPQKDLCLFYITCVRSVIDYAAPVFHHALPAYLSQELERVQKRAMRIICPGIEYQQALALMSLPTVAEHHHNICTRTFESIMSDPNHKLRKLLPPLYKSNYNLRHARTFTLPRCKTNRFKNSFFMASGRIVNNF